MVTMEGSLRTATCPRCGEALPRSARFCRRCGNRLGRKASVRWLWIAVALAFPVALLLRPQLDQRPAVQAPSSPAIQTHRPDIFDRLAAQDADAVPPPLPGFRDVGPAPVVVLPPPRELPADELRRLTGDNGDIGPGLEGLYGPRRYFSCTIHNGSSWFVAAVKIRVTFIGEKGEGRDFELERQIGAAPSWSRTLVGRLDEPLRPGQRFMWEIVSARGWPNRLGDAGR